MTTFVVFLAGMVVMWGLRYLYDRAKALGPEIRAEEERLSKSRSRMDRPPSKRRR